MCCVDHLIVIYIFLYLFLLSHIILDIKLQSYYIFRVDFHDKECLENEDIRGLVNQRNIFKKKV